MKTEISRADISEAEALAAFINRAYRGDSSRKGWTTEADLLEGSRTDAELVGKTLASAESVMLVCREKDQIIGCVELRQELHKTYLGMLTVDPERQGEGIGKHLMTAGEEFARQQGSRMIYMTVLTPRTELISWYVRHGYKNTGQTKPFDFTDPRFGQPKEPLEFVILTKKL